MKCVLEFGVRGGNLSENTVLPSVKLGAQLAVRMIHVFGGQSQFVGDWIVKRGKPRMTWTSSTHFVALSVLDGADRGPAAAQLWKKPCDGSEQGLEAL